MNALRLSVVDFQRLVESPSLGNLLWMGIQLTRTWTLLYNLVKKTNQAQMAGLGIGAGRAAGRVRGVMGYNVAMNALFDPTWSPAKAGLLASTIAGVTAVTSTLPTVTLGVGALGIGLAVGIPVAALIGIFLIGDIMERRKMKDWEQRQRDIAKSQGLEW